MIAPCSCGVSLLNDPVRRSGYQIPHGHAGLSAARRGRRSSQSSRSVSKPEAYVRPNIVSSGFWLSPAKGSALSTSRSPVTKKVGSSLIETTAMPRGSLTSWYRTASIRLDSSARWSGLASRQPPKAESCMKSRRSDVSRSAPCSCTSILVVSEALTSLPSNRWDTLPAPRVHLQVRIRAQATDLHERTAVPQPQPRLGAAVGAPVPRARDQRGELVTRGSTAERPPEVDALLGVEAQVEDTVGGEPAAVAARAERLRRGRDDPEDGAVGETVAIGGRGALLDDCLNRAIAPLEHRQHLGAAHHLVHRPARRAAHVHVLDEPHLGWHGTAVFDQLAQLVVVDVAHDHRVELRPGEAGRRHRGDAGEDLRVVRAACERGEPVGPQGVKAHGDAVQSGGPQRTRLLGEQDPVGRQGQIAKLRLVRQEADQRRQVAPQERLAAGEPDLVDAEIHEDVDERAELLEVEDLLARQPDVVLLGHAVAAAQVAAVGHRDPEVAQRTLKDVADRHQRAPAVTASSAAARSHSRSSPAFLTPTSK